VAAGRSSSTSHSVQPVDSIEQVFPCVAVAGPRRLAQVLGRVYGRLGLDVVGVGEVLGGDPEAATTSGDAPGQADSPAALVARAADAGAVALHPGGADPSTRGALAAAAAERGLVFLGVDGATAATLADPEGRARLAQALDLRVASGEEATEEGPDLERCRRVEVLVAIDGRGHAETLGERESSFRADPAARGPILREAPSPHLQALAEGEALREALFDASLRLAQQAEIRGLLSVEFVLDLEDRFHLVDARPGFELALAPTEMVLGVDLAELELRCFSEAGLPSELGAIHAYGAAVQADLVARGEVPAGIEELRIPPAPLGKLRVDLHVDPGVPIPEAGIPLVTLTAHGPVRHRALQLLDRVLAATRTHPVPTNVGILREALNDESVRAGFYDASSGRRIGGSPA
jgi:acetyl/propionyl-CoA carboxylase alpha subunit